MSAPTANRHTVTKRATRGLRLRRIGAALALTVAAAACASPEEKVERFTKSGQEFLEQREFGKANIQFQNALKINEEHVPALVGIAEVAENRQNYKRMFGALQTIIRLDPDNVETRVKLGKLYLVGSEETDALENADKALELAPDNADALALKAAVLLRIGDETQAVELAERALASDAGNAEAATVLATVRSRAQDYEGALVYLDGVLAVDPDQAVLHLLRLEMLQRLGRDEDVDAGHRALIEQFPDAPAYRRVYVRTLIQKGRLDDARAQLVEVAKLTPNEVEPVLDVVRIEYRLGGEEAAMAAFERFVADRPDDLDLRFAFATFLRQQQNAAEAEKIYSDIAALDDQPEARLRARNEIAALRLIDGKKEEARGIVEAILAEDERNTEALIKLAGLKVDDGLLDEAIRDLRTVLTDEPDSSSARLLMGAAFERQGDVALAESQMAQAVQDSDFAARETNIFAKFLVRNNEITRAENTLVESLSKNPSNVENLKFLAAIRLLQQDWRGAEEVGKIIERIDEQDPVADRILGAAYTGLEDYASAIDALEAANDDAPLAAQPLATLVSAYMRADRAEDAETLLNDMIAANDDAYVPRLLLARVLLA
ncbi:MAG: tetratricopeptide repeat protein, partial [Pseudomonadota bacterium]